MAARSNIAAIVGPVRLPAHLDRIVEGVYGLDDRPLARSHVRGLDDGRSAVFSYDPPQIASLYDFPRLPNGGEGVELVAAMIELGGVVHPFDLAASFARLGLNAPDITNVWLDGATPSPDPDGADVEVALDYQVIGSIVAAMAPKAHLTIVSYNAPNSERGFIDAVATAASDAIRHPAAVSISWGAPEDHWSPQGMRGLDAAFATGALHGVTFSAAAGDAGSTNAEVDGYQHPEFPRVEPTRMGVRRDDVARGSRPHPGGDGLERALARWRRRGERGQHRVPGPVVPGGARDPAAFRRWR